MDEAKSLMCVRGHLVKVLVDVMDSLAILCRASSQPFGSQIVDGIYHFSRKTSENGALFRERGRW